MTRYGAFISYSHADTAVARALHHALETYRIPKKLIGTETAIGIVPRRLPPVFRDRDELPASGDLGTELRAALAAAAFQIVLCSERAAQSHWVNEEILAFKRVHGDGRVLALIVSGEPYSATNECFPPALRFKTGPGGVLTTEAAEPIAADLRPGKDGRRLAYLKLIAGLTGLPLDALVQRDAARRQRRLAYIAGGAVTVALLTIGLAAYAVIQRREAEQQRELADSSLDFLIGTFSIANPATENPRTITAITILDRVSRRAGGSELKARPEVRARLLSATGDIYLNLGLGKEAERDLAAALRLQPARGAARAGLLLKLAGAALGRMDARRAKLLVAEAERTFDRGDPQAALLTARVADVRGRIAYLAGRYADAARQLDRAAALYGEADGDNRRAIGRAWLDEGVALGQIGQFAQADRAYAKAGALYVSVFGRVHVETAKATQNRALGALGAGRPDLALTLAERALVIYKRVLEPDHPTIADTYLLLGRIDHARGDLLGAAAALDRATAIFARIYGPANVAVGDAQYYAAQVWSDLGHHDEALRRLERTRRIYLTTYGLIDRDHVGLLAVRAQIHRAAGQTVEAGRDCRASLAMRFKIDAHDPELPAATKRCAQLLADPPTVSLLFQAAR